MSNYLFLHYVIDFIVPCDVNLFQLYVCSCMYLYTHIYTHDMCLNRKCLIHTKKLPYPVTLLENNTHSKGKQALKWVSKTRSNVKEEGNFRSYVAYEN